MATMEGPRRAFPTDIEYSMNPFPLPFFPHSTLAGVVRWMAADTADIVCQTPLTTNQLRCKVDDEKSRRQDYGSSVLDKLNYCK